MNTSAFDPLRLPYVSPLVPGIGGHIKSAPRHFTVEEIPLYEPCGSGEHVYLRLRRAGRTTREMIDALARTLAVNAREIGYAGEKDKHALATQTFSIPLVGIEPEVAARRVAEVMSVEVLSAARHSNKLRRGHLIGNRFDILVQDAHVEAVERATHVARDLGRHGLPNFYGPQRFGADRRNAERGRELLGSPRRDWKSRLMLSAFQAQLFNAWTVERMRRGLFEELLRGDVAKRLDNGALFDVVDVAVDAARMSAREITYTGPIYGARMRRASESAAELEQEILSAFDVDAALLAHAGVDGSRRAARIFVDDLEIQAEDSGLRIRVSLPKGAYATTLLREIMKSDGPLPPIDGEE